MAMAATTVKKPSKNSPIKRARSWRCERKQTPRNHVRAMRGRSWEKTLEDASLLMEQLDYNLLFRWFVGLNMDDAVGDATVFSKNRDRLLEGDVAEAFFDQVLAEAQGRDLLSDEHFTVDGTLVEAWASQKSFQKKDAEPGPPPEDRGNPTVNFHGEKRSNETQQSTTDPEARLARKGNGKEAKLSYAGHVLMENRNVT